MSEHPEITKLYQLEYRSPGATRWKRSATSLADCESGAKERTERTAEMFRSDGYEAKVAEYDVVRVEPRRRLLVLEDGKVTEARCDRCRHWRKASTSSALFRGVAVCTRIGLGDRALFHPSHEVTDAAHGCAGFTAKEGA